jgi:hypothetical protein
MARRSKDISTRTAPVFLHPSRAPGTSLRNSTLSSWQPRRMPSRCRMICSGNTGVGRPPHIRLALGSALLALSLTRDDYCHNRNRNPRLWLLWLRTPSETGRNLLFIGRKNSNELRASGPVILLFLAFQPVLAMASNVSLRLPGACSRG